MSSEPIVAVLEGTLGKRQRSRSVLSDYWSLTKPEVNFLIALTTFAAFCLGAPQEFAQFPWLLLVNTMLGTVFVASGAATLNQVIERRFDAQMRRTARRPIAAGRIEATPAVLFGILLSVAGLLQLALFARPLASLFALLTLGGYLFLYTPLKRRTPMCTLVGAFPGAMPVLIGFVAATGKLTAQAWELYAILLLWQFPHFMAIAWMYREDYARAGYKVLPAASESPWFLRVQSALPAIALIPLTVIPMASGHANPVLPAGMLLVGLAFAYYALRLALVHSNGAARRLLLASIVYLPAVFVLEVFAQR